VSEGAETAFPRGKRDRPELRGRGHGKKRFPLGEARYETVLKEGNEND